MFCISLSGSCNNKVAWPSGPPPFEFEANKKPVEVLKKSNIFEYLQLNATKWKKGQINHLRQIKNDKKVWQGRDLKTSPGTGLVP